MRGNSLCAVVLPINLVTKNANKFYHISIMLRIMCMFYENRLTSSFVLFYLFFQSSNTAFNGWRGELNLGILFYDYLRWQIPRGRTLIRLRAQKQRSIWWVIPFACVAVLLLFIVTKRMIRIHCMCFLFKLFCLL